MTPTGILVCGLVVVTLSLQAFGEPDEPAPQPGVRLSKAQVLRLARVALAGITRE